MRFVLSLMMGLLIASPALAEKVFTETGVISTDVNFNYHDRNYTYSYGNFEVSFELQNVRGAFQNGLRESYAQLSPRDPGDDVCQYRYETNSEALLRIIVVKRQTPQNQIVLNRLYAATLASAASSSNKANCVAFHPTHFQLGAVRLIDVIGDDSITPELGIFGFRLGDGYGPHGQIVKDTTFVVGTISPQILLPYNPQTTSLSELTPEMHSTLTISEYVRGPHGEIQYGGPYYHTLSKNVF